MTYDLKTVLWLDKSKIKDKLIIIMLLNYLLLRCFSMCASIAAQTIQRSFAMKPFIEVEMIKVLILRGLNGRLEQSILSSL